MSSAEERAADPSSVPLSLSTEVLQEVTDVGGVGGGDRTGCVHIRTGQGKIKCIGFVFTHLPGLFSRLPIKV